MPSPVPESGKAIGAKAAEDDIDSHRKRSGYEAVDEIPDDKRIAEGIHIPQERGILRDHLRRDLEELDRRLERAERHPEQRESDQHKGHRYQDVIEKAASYPMHTLIDHDLPPSVLSIDRLAYIEDHADEKTEAQQYRKARGIPCLECAE